VAETPEFRNWFGDSQVVDDQGKPLVVYHGGRGGITAFNPPNAYRAGIFFTDSAKAADDFGAGGSTYPVYLAMNNPFTLDAGDAYYSDLPKPAEMQDWDTRDTTTTDLVAEWAAENGFDGVIIRNVLEGRGNETSDV